MHIVKFTFECGGFDFEMMRGGMSLSAWNLARGFAARGHRVSIVTPAHGRLDYLADRYGLEELDCLDRHQLPLVPDPDVWSDLPPALNVPLTTRAHKLRLDGVDMYFLSNEYLDLLADRFYPAKTSEGTDLAFFKPLAFQVSGTRFIQRCLAERPTVIQAYEPLYHYLLPLAFRDANGVRTVSTVASNMPIDQKVYLPQVEALLDLVGVSKDAARLSRYAEPPVEGRLADVMRDHLPSTLYRDYPPGYVGVFPMVAESCDLLNFLSDGQKDYTATFRDTPFEALFTRLRVSQVVKETAHKRFVGGCGISDDWLGRDPGSVDRAAVLNGLDLDPARPTFYHSSRYSLHHKGQLELMRAIDAVLATDREVNFVVRCLVAAGDRGRLEPANEYFAEVAARHPGNVHLDWRMVDEDTHFAQAVAADFCVFPSKFELDTFLIAQGEAMACGAVPVATAQEGTRHFLHGLDRGHPDATGFAVPRSFREDDPVLVEALVARIHEAVRTFREDPQEYQRLSGNASQVARGFTWDSAVDRHLRMFELVASGGVPRLSDEDMLASHLHTGSQ